MGLSQAYQLDDLDLQILDILIKDCRTPYLEIARLCHVSGGPKQKEKKIEIRPKAKPNRVKHLNNAQNNTNNKK